MANDHVIRTAKLTDRQVLDLMYALKEELEIVSAYLSPGLGKTIEFENSKEIVSLLKYSTVTAIAFSNRL